MGKYLYTAIAGLIGSLLVSGCSTSSTLTTNSTTQNSTSKIESHNTTLVSSSHWVSVNDKSFLLQGKIVEIDGKEPYTLKIHLDQVIVSGAVSPQPKFPERIGTIVTVRLKQPFAKHGSLRPRDGEVVMLDVKQYTRGRDTTPFWGSDMSHYYYQKNGNFYASNGSQVAFAT